MAHWRSIRIVDVLEEIEERRLVLPIVQRDLVWKEEQIELLFDTLMRGDSFGGIMTIKDIKGKMPLFDYRYFVKDYHSGAENTSANHGELKHEISYVVDGQQRLSAFYIGLIGSYNNSFLYFDILGECEHKDFNFKFAQNPSDLKNEIDNFDGTQKIPTLWLSVTDLFNRFKNVGNDTEVVKNALFDDFKKEIDNEHKQRLVSGNLTKFQQEVFISPNIGLCEVTINRNLAETENKQNVVELFRRLNLGGTKLDGLDLMASKLKAFDSRNEKFLASAKNEFSDIGFNQDEIIKLIFILQDDYKKEISDVSKSDSDFIINQEERILFALNATRHFLRMSNLESFYKEHNPSIIPLYFIAYFVFHQNITNKQVENFFENHDTVNYNFHEISNWIKLSLLNKVFRRKGAGWTAYKTGIRKILEVMKNHKGNDFPKDEIFNMYQNHSIVFYPTVEDKWELLAFFDRDFVMYLIYDLPKNFRRNDIDHIHPKSILEQKGIEWGKINNIANYQLLHYEDNRGSKSANELKNWIEDNIADIPYYLNFHLIPQDKKLWVSDNYFEFLEQRKTLIINKIKDNISL